jgi:hypothetical protein
MPTPEGSRLIPIAVEGSSLPSPQAVLVTDSKLPPVAGTYHYHAGVSGTFNVPAGERVTQLTATGGTGAASMTIAGGDVITIPANMAMYMNPNGNITAPSCTFTSTVSWVIETVS